MFINPTYSDDKNDPIFIIPGLASHVDLSYKDLQEQMKHERQEPPCPDKDRK